MKLDRSNTEFREGVAYIDGQPLEHILNEMGVYSIEINVDPDYLPDTTPCRFVNFNKFSTFNHEVIPFLEAHFNDIERVRIFDLSRFLKTHSSTSNNMNILYQTQRTLLTRASLKEFLGLKRAAFYRLWKKLIDFNVIVEAEIDGKVSIMLSPYISMRGRKVKISEVEKYFQPLKLDI